ncbi:LigB family dioxygenase [Pseudooceanicola marinus]|uniref:LigB family dioxygenase n=1 Tax=Pseudooceanicola marinus TaxID=396013 RepID=A0A1X7A7B2_9RHOB|nr:4,5-DOPA dioxygenase extradiol [Pseudooceanicola marinus]PJE27197.1 4,5-DOPA dioxygenase extradiol [Pseudooceanicola marinus]SLN70765.1 LigB family dioxygenase [Pseudooceanicola marinus]
MSIAQDLRKLAEGLQRSDRLPVVFLGHGSPMNAIEDNDYSRSWTKLGETLPRPQAILVVSAHWMTRGSTLVNVSAMPQTIHDFYGFPQQLFDLQYPAPGAPDVAKEVVSILASHPAEGGETWGLDHGAWSVLKFLYPGADVPVFQLSIDMTKDLPHHVEIGQALRALRDRGVLILGSGNVVHNLRAVRWDKGAAAWDWAEEFDALFADRLGAGDIDTLADRGKLGKLLQMAHPSVDHYLPALTVAGAADARDSLLFMTDDIDLGSVSMRSFVYY